MTDSTAQDRDLNDNSANDAVDKVIDKIIDNVIVFDGICNLCNSAVNFIIQHDNENIFRFTPIQSSSGKSLLLKYGMSPDDVKSFLLVKGGQPYMKSDAALAIAAEFGFGWRGLIVFGIFPKFLRDAFYDVIAAKRYRWFGKRELCLVPTAEIKDKFID